MSTRHGSPSSRSTPRPTWTPSHKVYFDRKAKQDRLYAVLTPVVERFEVISEDEKHDFRGQLTD